MQLEIKVKGFKLTDAWRSKLERGALAIEQRFGAIAQLKIAVSMTTNALGLLSTIDIYDATATIELGSQSRVDVTGAGTDLSELASSLFRAIAIAIRRQHWLDDGVGARCRWCNNNAFACAPHEDIGKLEALALICTECGAVEPFIVDTMAIADAKLPIVRSRAESPYR